MFTGFAEHAVALLADVAQIYPLGADADLSPSSHPLMVLAEPSTLALTIIGAGVLAITQRARRRRHRVAHVPHTAKSSQKAGEIPTRGAA